MADRLATLTPTEREAFDSLVLDFHALDPAVRPAAQPAAAPLAESTVPLLTGVQAQGDLLVVPTTGPLPYSAQPLPDGHRLPLIDAGNGHLLAVDTSRGGSVHAGVVRRGHVLAVVEVTGLARAYLEQPAGIDAHTPIGLAAGRYEVRRQIADYAPSRGVVAARRVREWVSD